MKFGWLPILLICLLACEAGAAVKKTAKGSEPFIDYLFPAGGQRGTNVQVTASGRNLAQVIGVRIAGTGVSAKLSRVEPPTPIRGESGETVMNFTLPRQGVSLLVIDRVR